MNNNNIDVSSLMNMLSKMDKKDLERGLNQLGNVLNSNDGAKLINQLKNNISNK